MRSISAQGEILDRKGLKTIFNYQLDREILGFGECVKIHAPQFPVASIKKRLDMGSEKYP